MKLWVDVQLSPAITAWINRTFDAALVLNDVEYEPKSDLLDALEVGNVEIYYWSDKERMIEALA